MDLFSEYLLSVFCGLGFVFGIGDIVVNRINNVLVIMKYLVSNFWIIVFYILMCI